MRFSLQPRSRKAIQSYEAMQQGQLAPDLLTFHVASSACNAASQWRQGATLLRQLRKRMVRCELLTFHVIWQRYELRYGR